VRHVNGVGSTRITQGDGGKGGEIRHGVTAPPLQSPEELHHGPVRGEQDHAVITATVHPAAAAVGRHAGTLARGLARGLVAARHADLPGAPATGLGAPLARGVLPEILVAVLLDDLWHDASALLLVAPLAKHEVVLALIPALDELHPRPVHASVRLVVGRGEVVVGVPFEDEGTQIVRPLRVGAVEVVLVPKVPGYVGESGQPRDAVTVVEMLLGASLGEGRGKHLSANEEDDRDGHVPLPGIAEHPLVLPPELDIEAGEIETRVVDVPGPLGRPGLEVKVEAAAGHNRLAPRSIIIAAVEEHSQPIHAQSSEAVDDAADGRVVPPHQVVRGRAIQQEVLAVTLPDEVPGMLGVDAEDTLASHVDGLKTARLPPFIGALAERDHVLVGAGLARREADAVEGTVHGVAEPIDIQPHAARSAEGARHLDVNEGVRRIRSRY